jgi:hypothetical protein
VKGLFSCSIDPFLAHGRRFCAGQTPIGVYWADNIIFINAWGGWSPPWRPFPIRDVSHLTTVFFCHSKFEMSQNLDECSSPAPLSGNEDMENEIAELILRGKEYATGHGNFTHKQLKGMDYLI